MYKKVKSRRKVFKIKNNAEANWNAEYTSIKTIAKIMSG